MTLRSRRRTAGSAPRPRLDRDGALTLGWSLEEAADLLWAILFIGNWESLTLERGWPTDRYVSRMQELTKRAFVRGSEGA